MQSVQLELPAMYGDHHVLAVRQMLLGMEGIKQVKASAAWRAVKIDYDPDKLSPEQIEKRLANEGYTEMPHTPALEPEGGRTQRFTQAFVQAGKQVSFSAYVPFQETRPLFPCPGMAPVRPEPAD